MGWLLASGADVNAKNNRGDTPLGVALQDGKVEAAELLRQYGSIAPPE